jgi:hypothetical protein
MAVLIFILGVWIVLGFPIALFVGKFMRIADPERKPLNLHGSAASSNSTPNDAPRNVAF